MAESRKTGMSVKELRQFADTLFGKRTPLLSFWQEVAENFYPMRADFTVKRSLGNDFAGNLMTSYPILCQRDLQEQIGTMLRNRNKPWFKMAPKDPRDEEDHDLKEWLEWATGVQRRVMYAPATLFTKATSQGDADYSCFGQAVLTVRMNREHDDLLFRCWHLRDVVWIEDEAGKICAVFRRWKPDLRTMCRLFDGRPGTSVHRQVLQDVKKDPSVECDCYHFMVAAVLYDGDAKGMPWRSIYYDAAHEHEMESVAQKRREYIIPRWLTVSGSQYAHSPATVAALPEARLLQSMTYTLLEAGEKIVNPPLIATEQVVRSDMALYSGGVTWIDKEYDQRTGDALSPLLTDARGMPLSKDMQMDSRSLIAKCFYLNRLDMPERASGMSEYEVSQRIQQYIRAALPLFEPMEAEYNGSLCEETFGLTFDNGGFGSLMDMPAKIRSASAVEFRFSSPLHDAVEMERGQKFLEAKQLLAEAVALDKSAYAILDAKAALRDALSSIGVPAKWTRSEAEVIEMERNQAAQQQTAELLANLAQGAGVAKDLAFAQAAGKQGGGGGGGAVAA